MTAEICPFPPPRSTLCRCMAGRPARRPLGAECAGMETNKKRRRYIFEGSLLSLSKAKLRWSTYIPVASRGRELPSFWAPEKRNGVIETQSIFFATGSLEGSAACPRTPPQSSGGVLWSSRLLEHFLYGLSILWLFKGHILSPNWMEALCSSLLSSLVPSTGLRGDTAVNCQGVT